MSQEMRKASSSLLLWFIACFLPSLMTSILEARTLNAIPDFHRSPFDIFKIARLLTLVSAIYTLPIVLFLRFKTKHKSWTKKKTMQIYGPILSYSLLIYFLHFYLTQSILEASYITLPCLFLVLGFTRRYQNRIHLRT